MERAPYIQDSPTTETLKNTWAKYDWKSEEWLPLHRHLDDIACVAGALWDTWLSPNSRALISASFDCDEEFGRKIAIFLASGHDIGKCSSAFAEKSPTCAARMTGAGAVFLTLSKKDRKLAPHGIISALSLRDWLKKKVQPEDYFSIGCLEVIVAGHHGIFPSQSDLRYCKPYLREKTYQWHKDRMQLWERAARTAGLTDSDLIRLTSTALPRPAQMTLCGFIIMADWIASNTNWFPLSDYRSSVERTEAAFASLNLPQAWQPEPPENDGELFHRSFTLPETASPRPVQESAMSLARTTAAPCLMLIEAPTGEGKTEAALTAAEILASRFNLTGVTIALPTCATSDAMFPRMLRWLENRLPHNMQANTVLCHGKAQFNDEYTSLFDKLSGDFAPIYSDEETEQNERDDKDVTDKPSFMPHWWFSGRKTSALSDFTIGTIDQVLFGALRSRHVALRHLGFSNKVIILDEIHCADAYMSVYLDRVLTWLGAMKLPVIALSATLDPKRRGELLAAYRSGTHEDGGLYYLEYVAETDTHAAQDQHGYPLISIASCSGLSFSTLAPSGRSTEFAVKYVGPEPSSLVEKIVDLSGNGGCVGVVCNTIARAQQVFEEVKHQVADNVEVVLLHSRFAAFQRRQIEKKLVSWLGPGSETRPTNLIVISTQVIEQSMDIDFDCMITDIAPMDLIFQRAGRLHRHNRPKTERPSAFHLPTLYISGCSAPTKAQVPTIDKGSKAVYGEYGLLRTLRVLQLHERLIKSPEDVADFVRLAYHLELDVPESWQNAYENADRKAQEKLIELQNRAETYLMQLPFDDEPIWDGVAIELKDEIRGQAQVRDIDDSLDVILMEYVNDGYRILSSAPNLGGDPIDFRFPIPDDQAKLLAMCTVSLPQWVLHGEQGNRLLDALELEILSEEEVFNVSKNKWLKEQLFLPLHSDLKTEIAGLSISYSDEVGLKVTSSAPGREEQALS